MRVLWLATSPSLYIEGKTMGWIGALEHVIRKHSPEIELGIAFEYPDSKFKVERSGVTYYPINLKPGWADILKMKFNGNDNWYLKKPILLNIIEDFNPDIIHCFGSEWNWGLIADEIKTPVVLHMQGFINIYNDANAKIHHKPLPIWLVISHPREMLQRIFLKHYDRKRNQIERQIMQSCHFFMGRTEWDYGVVKYFGKNAKYYHCPEAIRPAIFNSQDKWSYRKNDIIRLVTIASAGNLKGNGIILETARILKEMGVRFEWRVSGDKNIFALFERTTGIRASNVGITLLGYIDVEQVRQELLDAEMYILPSIMDNSPNSLCEAQLVGTPVIASYVGGIPQMVENNKTGILYPYNEPYSLAFKILDLHNSPETLMELSANEIEMSHRRHNPVLLAKRIQEIYSDVINNQ